MITQQIIDIDEDTAEALERLDREICRTAPDHLPELIARRDELLAQAKPRPIIVGDVF